MSLDKSLKSKSKLFRRRNVLKRDERIVRLLQEERWSEGQSAFGLPKVKVRAAGRKRAGKKPEKAEPAEEASEGAAEAEESEQ